MDIWELLAAPAFWFVLGLILIVLEMLVPTMFLVWFSVAALVVMALAFLQLPVLWLLIIWAILSVVLSIFTRPLTRKWFRPRTQVPSLGMEGKKGIVIKALDPIGLVSVEGVEWSARAHEEAIPDGAEVVVVRQDGAYLVVRPADSADR